MGIHYLTIYMCKLIIILLLLLSSIEVSAQVDTQKIMAIAKVHIYLDFIGHDKDSNYSKFGNILSDRGLKVKALSSFGFDKELSFFKVLNADSLFKRNGFDILNNEDYYIFAIDRLSFQFYRLKGFVENDLIQLVGIGTNRRKLNKMKVEELDLECIYNGLQKNGYQKLSDTCLYFSDRSAIIR